MSTKKELELRLQQANETIHNLNSIIDEHNDTIIELCAQNRKLENKDDIWYHLSHEILEELYHILSKLPEVDIKDESILKANLLEELRSNLYNCLTKKYMENHDKLMEAIQKEDNDYTLAVIRK